MDYQVVNRALHDINSSFSSILLESNFHCYPGTVSWPNYTPGVPSALAYAAEYQRLIDRKQFSFLLIDKSFFQFYFKFEGDVLTSARLAYYPAPLQISGAIQDIVEAAEISGLDLLEELYFGAESWIDRGIDIVNTSHIRLDFDSAVRSHSHSHIQFGGLNSLRIPSEGVVSPLVFFEWICKNSSMKGVPELTNGERYLGISTYHLRRGWYSGGLDLRYPYIVLNRD